MSLAALARYGLARAPAGGGDSNFWAVDATGFTEPAYSNRAGWRFTVGAEDLVVNRLRLLAFQTSLEETLVLHDFSDGSILAQGAIPSGGSLGYVAVPVDEVTLLAGQDYVISSRAPAGRTVGRNPTSQTFFSGLTYVTGLFGGAGGTAIPTSTTSNVYTWVDFGYQE